MKNLFLIGLAIVLFTACENNVKQRYTQQSPEIETAKANIADYDNKNWESMISHYADTAKIYYNSMEPLSPEGVIEYHKANDVNYTSRGFELKGQEYEMVLTDDGETWVNFWGNWKCTLAANNKEYKIPIHLTSQYVNGKVVKEYGYWDNSEVILALQEITAANMMTDTITTIEE